MYHKDLEAWKKSIELVTKVYSEIKNFPEDEKYGLVSQIKRSIFAIISGLKKYLIKKLNHSDSSIT